MYLLGAKHPAKQMINKTDAVPVLPDYTTVVENKTATV